MTIFVQPKIIELYRVEKSSVYTLLTAISKVGEGRGGGVRLLSDICLIME